MSGISKKTGDLKTSGAIQTRGLQEDETRAFSVGQTIKALVSSSHFDDLP